MLRLRSLLLTTALLAACSPGTSLRDNSQDWEGWPWMTTRVLGTITMTGSVAPAGTARPVTITLTNAGNAVAHLEHGYCSFGVRLYQGGNATPKWHNSPPANTVCILSVVAKDLVPGERYDYVVATLDLAVLSSQLAAGKYDVAISWREEANGPVKLVSAGSVTLPPGTH